MAFSWIKALDIDVHGYELHRHLLAPDKQIQPRTGWFQSRLPFSCLDSSSHDLFLKSEISKII